MHSFRLSSPGGVPDLVDKGASSRGLFDPPPREPTDSRGEASCPPPLAEPLGLAFAALDPSWKASLSPPRSSCLPG